MGCPVVNKGTKSRPLPRMCFLDRKPFAIFGLRQTGLDTLVWLAINTRDTQTHSYFAENLAKPGDPL